MILKLIKLKYSHFFDGYMMQGKRLPPSGSLWLLSLRLQYAHFGNSLPINGQKSKSDT
jgi:hypothetical protein